MVSYENENQWAVQYPAIVFQAWKNKFHSRLHQTSPKHASYRRSTTEGDPSRRGDVFVRTKLQLLVRLTTTLNRRPPEASRRQLPTASLHGTRKKERALIHRCVRVRLFFSVASHLFAFTLPPAAISRRFVDGCPPCQALKEGDEAWLFRPTQLPWWFSPARNNTGERARVSALWKAGRNYFW